jgi:hypothetical protein
MFLLCALLVLALAPARAQVGGASFTTEQQRVLELKKLELTLKQARARFDRAKRLFDAGLSTPIDLSQAEVEYRNAEVNFQQAFLQLFADVPRISFVSAIKSQAPNGKKSVRLTLKNTSGAVMDYKSFGIDLSDVPVPDELKLRELTNVSVSLREYATGSSGPIISSPYEALIPTLAVGQERTLQFELLKDVDSVTVAMTYAGKLDQREVYLEKDASANIVTIASATFSQEADLGGQATYDLALEQFTRAASSFRLTVLNLPRQVNYEFIDPATSSRLFQVRFPEGVTALKLQLRLSLPDKVDERILLDRPLAFWVVVPESAAEPLAADRSYSAGEIAALKCGKVQLELTPRGVGRLEVSAPSLYQEIKPGETVTLNVTVKNSGTRRIHNVHVATENPINWRTEVTPDVVPALEPNREEVVSIRILPPADVGVGDFEVRIKTEAIDQNRKVQSEDKTDRIHVSSPASLRSTLWLLGFLLLLVVGIVIFSIKLTRR